MTVESLQSIATGCWVAAGIFCLITIALFFILKVPELIGDLSGATARKGIAAIRQNTEEGDGAGYRTKKRARQRHIVEQGNVTEKLPAEKIDKAAARAKTKSKRHAGNNKTAKLNINTGSNETTKLNINTGNNETTKLNMDAGSNETTKLNVNAGSNEPAVSSGKFNFGQTEKLRRTAENPLEQVDFQVNVEMGFAESGEIIE